MLNQLKDYLIFSRKERIGFIVVIIVVALVFAIPILLNNKKKPAATLTASQTHKPANKQEEKQVEEKEQENYNSFEDYKKPPVSLFYFDPNNTSAADWKKLGLRDKTIRTIHNYLSKGGHFYKLTDLKKIYGLRNDEFERLHPYIRLAETPGKEYQKRENSYTQNKYEENYKANDATPTVVKKKAIIIDINIADTAEWITLPGIGSKRAWSIVNFRSKLGGFYSIDQVGETYNIPDSVFRQIRSMLQVNPESIKKININTATKEELKMHPYIKWNLANAIVEYRNQHGPYTKPEDLLKIAVMTDELYRKMLPYLEW